MPKALDWGEARDAEALALYRKPGATGRGVAVAMGVSRSFMQRRLAALLRTETRVSQELRDPLPAFHPVSYRAVLELVPFHARLHATAMARRPSA